MALAHAYTATASLFLSIVVVWFGLSPHLGTLMKPGQAVPY